jgi:hypothetical protein
MKIIKSNKMVVAYFKAMSKHIPEDLKEATKALQTV